LKEQEACTLFMTVSFTSLVRRVIEEQVLPLVVAQNVEYALRMVDMKAKLSAENLEVLMRVIHDRIMAHLFKETQTMPKAKEQVLYDSYDETDSNSNKKPDYALSWIIEKIVDEYKQNQEL
jgi:hypothetical protein